METQTILVIVFLLNAVGIGTCIKWLFNVEHHRLNHNAEINYLKESNEKLKTELAATKEKVVALQHEHTLLQNDFGYIKSALDEIKAILRNR